MSPILADNSLSIGHTPLVQLNRVTEGCRAKVLAKDAPLAPGTVAETTDDNGGRLSSESPGFDHHKVAQDIFR